MSKYKELDVLSKDLTSLSTENLLSVIGLLELVRNLCERDKLYTQRIVGLSRATEHEDVLDCKYVRLALAELLQSHSGDFKRVMEILGEISETK